MGLNAITAAQSAITDAMKPKHVKWSRITAKATLTAIGAALGQPFETLEPKQIEKLLKDADIMHWFRSHPADFPRARKVYDMLQRHAKMKAPGE
jgi:hypothetical protein